MFFYFLNNYKINHQIKSYNVSLIKYGFIELVKSVLNSALTIKKRLLKVVFNFL